MRTKEIVQYIDSFAPFSTAMPYDNCGLLIGSGETEPTGAVVSLDATLEALQYALENRCNLVVTHHPIIFNALKRIDTQSAVYQYIRYGVSVISAHTNLDMVKGGLNDALAKRLGLTGVTGLGLVSPNGPVYEGRVGMLPAPLTPDALAGQVKERLGLEAVGLVCREGLEEKPLTRVAVCSGAGSSLLYDCAQEGADALVTSEIQHNIAQDALDMGIVMIDGGHYGTEILAVPLLAKRLEEQFPELPVFPFVQQPPIRAVY